jgi:hypothetical protein
LFPAYQVFSRRQLLLIQRYAIESGQSHPELSEANAAHAFGVIALMVNDHLHFGLAGTETENEKVMRNLFVEMIPISEDVGSNVYAKLTRAATLMEEIAPTLSSHNDYIDLADAFYKRTDVRLSEFHATCFAILSKWVNKVRGPIKPNDVFLQEVWLKDSNLDKSAVSRIFSALSADINQYKEEFTGKKREDFTPFRAYPLLKLEAGYLPTDITNVADVIESFPFWTISESADPDRLRRFWGSVFEEYMVRVTVGAADKRINYCVPRPTFQTNGEELCDLAVMSGKDLVLIEAKGVMFTREAKYSGQPLTCFQEIHRKLVRNQKGKNKGVSQLASSIRRAFIEKEAINSLDISGIRRVFPVIVTLDSIGENPLFSNILNLYFDSTLLSNESGIVVERMLGMSIETYEHITALLSDTQLATVLYDWLDNPPLKTWIGSHAMIDTPLARLTSERRNPYVEKRFRDITSKLSNSLFPG